MRRRRDPRRPPAEPDQPPGDPAEGGGLVEQAPPGWRMRLRTRMMLAFSVISLTVVVLSALATWFLATGYMTSQRERSAVRQASINAELVDTTLRQEPELYDRLMTNLFATSDTAVLVILDGSWRSWGGLSPDDLDGEFRREVEAGHPVLQRTRLDDRPVLLVSQPMPEVSGSYVEAFQLDELDRTMRFLSVTLVATAVAGALVGALFGLRATRTALRPLAELNAAARAIARGESEIRLPATRDADLAALAAAFAETATKLRQRVERDARFASNVSHELRSPLTTMVNACAVLVRRRAEMPASAQAALDLLADELGRFERLVRDLLEISREDQADDGIWEPVDLVELARHALPGVDIEVAGRNGAAAGRGGAPGRSLPPGPFAVCGDRRRLERVIANLRENAEQHGGGLVRFALIPPASDGWVRIEVDDAGPGIEDADKERVFERFARGSTTARAGGGAGLGLALAADHIRRHRGRIWVEDRPGGGARFVIELPAAGDRPG